MDETLAAWVALQLVAGLGGESQRRLLQAFGSPEAIFAASPASLRQHVKPAIASAIADGPDAAQLELTKVWLQDPLNHILTLADSDYPQALLNTADPPILLYVKGRLDLLNAPALAIVGSRNATAQGAANAEAFAQAAGDAGLTVISGLAQGIDTAAHRGALGTTGSSIAVVGTGLDRVYPASNHDLARRLAETGALISEFPLGMPPLAANFPRRNRIISGMSLGCLVVEASVQSGSLITARMALEQGREVFAIPGSIHSPQSRGCHHLIRQGAKLVESAQDIQEELGNFPSLAASSPSPSEPHPVLEHLGGEALDMDTLRQRSGLTIDALSAILIALELDGLVANLPGGLWQRIVKP